MEGCGCMRCGGIKLLIVGAAVVLNDMYNFTSWATLIGGLLIVGGLVKAARGTCSCSTGKKKR